MHPGAMIGDLELMVPAVWAWLAGTWQSFAQNAGTVLVTSIWQGAVIVCGLEIALRMTPRISAAYRFAVWVAGFAAAVGLPLLPLIHFGTHAAGPASTGSRAQAHALMQIDVRWGLAIAGLWVAASVIRGAGLLVHSMRLWRLWETAEPVEISERLLAALRHVRRGNVQICTTERLDRPSVIGFVAPRILIPAWLIDRLTPGELEQIVLHEAEHLRRSDDWTNLVQKLVLVAFPLNPALAWMEHQLCREREMACDEGVVRVTNAPRAYAACLASLAEHGLERRAEALSLGAWHKRSELVHRVHGILLRKPAISRTAAGALFAAIGCSLVTATIEMARAPQLIAFVPEQKAMTPERQQQMVALLAKESADSKMMLPTGYRAVQAKAILPPVRQAKLVSSTKHENLPTEKSSSSGLVQQVVKSDVTADRVNRGSEQKWVVLAAWEEVQTVSRRDEADQVTDFDGNASVPKQNDPKASGQKTKTQDPASSYTVTQLILRVVPANQNSKSTQPLATMVRGGWLVIQL